MTNSVPPPRSHLPRLVQAREKIEEAQRAVPASGLGTYRNLNDHLYQAWAECERLIQAATKEALKR